MKQVVVTIQPSLQLQFALSDKFSSKMKGFSCYQDSENVRIYLHFRSGTILVFVGKDQNDAEQRVRDYLETGVYTACCGILGLVLGLSECPRKRQKKARE